MRIFTRRVALLAVLLLAVVEAKALYSRFVINGITYVYNAGETSVVAINEEYEGDLIIPSSVVLNGEWYTVERINSKAFWGCKGLTSVKIPYSVTYIGNEAFWGCKSLTSVEIPSSVTYIGDGAFGCCDNLVSINVLPGNTSYKSSGGLLYEKPSYGSIHLAAVPAGLSPSAILNEIEQHTNLYINTFAFAGCNKLESIKLPSSTQRLGIDAFYGCKNLQSVTVPATIDYIYPDAFSGCTNLTSFDVYQVSGRTPNYSMKNGLLFSDGDLAVVPSGLKSVELPADYGYSYDIGKQAFCSCDSLYSVVIPYNVKRIEERAFENCSSLTSVDINSSVRYIGDYAFYNCSNLTSITLPHFVTSIGNGAFHSCSSLTSIKIASYSSVTSIGDYAFYNCSKLTSIEIPSSVKSIGGFAFGGCSNLKQIVIPEYVNTLSHTSFQNCQALQEIVMLTENESCLNIFNQMLDNLQANNTVTVYSLEPIFEKLPNMGNVQKKHLFSVKTSGAWFSRITFSFDQVAPFATIGNVSCYKNLSQKNGVYTIDKLTPGACPIIVHFSINDVSHSIQYMLHTAELNVELTDSGATTAVLHGYYTDGASVSGEGFEGYDVDGNTLELAGLDPGTEYTVQYYVVTDEEGTFTKDFTFHTEALEFETLPAKATSNTVALICAETNLSDMETGAGFEWRRYDAPDLVPSTKSPCPVVDGVLTGALRNLSASTYYKFRPYYTSASGETYYGEWLAFGTADAYVYFDPTVRTYEATGVTATEAHVRGHAIAGSDDITEQGFEYWATGTVSKRSATNVRRVQATGQFMTATLEDLQPGTTYTFRVYVETAKGTTYGEEQTFTTEGNGTGIAAIGSDDTEGLEVAVRGNLAQGGAALRVTGDGGEAFWTLTTLSGSVAAQGSVTADGTWQALEASALPRGIYLLTVRNGQSAKTVKVTAL